MARLIRHRILYLVALMLCLRFVFTKVNRFRLHVAAQASVYSLLVGSDEGQNRLHYADAGTRKNVEDCLNGRIPGGF
jgi:hypothetical protein